MINTKAMVFTEYGSPDVLTLQTIDVADPGQGELLLKVLAAGFNPLDTKVRSGLAPVATESGTTGCDVCGEVIALGEGVDGFAIGDRVYGMTGGVRGTMGTVCEYVLADARLLARAPANLTNEAAACLPVVALTAMEIFQRLRPSSDSQLLVLGGLGGVGRMVLQLALHQGLTVTATAGSSERLDILRTMGVEALAHHAVADLVASGKSFDCVVDTHGGDSLTSALNAVAAWGDVATINARGTHDLSPAHAKSLTLHAIFKALPLLTGKGREQLGRDLVQFAAWVEEGVIDVPEPESVAAIELASVHKWYEQGQLQGKVALVWPDQTVAD
ncbi:zinc-binding dehydrogenase [Oceanobacter sp. 3_MG-2023]|uniref:alcohol dehydrogenase catalytic domain-containing protein n=1 Tax=Oceanobacter sp. 3_MG-2023 TaxID=3062622 RepID=UPI00273316B2|nr:zinc-binding dehydrogenase [Oceanobacter sp. 3_MG-2023]MDP2506748.1 zinc-binding dehydrogenase [Oceanobacter sp. 3_MG-2023]